MLCPSASQDDGNAWADMRLDDSGSDQLISLSVAGMSPCAAMNDVLHSYGKEYVSYKCTIGTRKPSHSWTQSHSQIVELNG